MVLNKKASGGKEKEATDVSLKKLREVEGNWLYNVCTDPHYDAAWSGCK